MKRLRTLLLALLCCATTPALAEPELLAGKNSPQYASLRPLTNGLSALNLMWPLNDLSEGGVSAVHAGLATIIGGPTPTQSAFEAETFREINGINLSITIMPEHIMLTMTAPPDAFNDALIHTRDLLTNPEFSEDWYARQLVQQRPLLATKTRRPTNVVGALSDFIIFPDDTETSETPTTSYVFGMPSHIVARSNDPELRTALGRFISGLPRQRSDVDYPTSTLAELPKGVIYAPDPDSRETLVYLVKHETFDGPEDMVGANVLMDYMGAYQGSEMFRIIRQELRAAYNPTSDFEQIAKNRALLSLSATVQSDEWPKILNEIKAIYNRTRAGEATDQGLNNTKRRMINGLDYRFSTNPQWGAGQYMDEYGKGASGQIDFPLFRASVNADIETIRKNGSDHLPPIEDYLLILIGGTNPPPDAMRANGYCEQPLSKPLRYCIKQLR